MRDQGFAQSRLYLPKLPGSPKTVLEHLAAHFQSIPKQVWVDRIAAQRVWFSDGTAVLADTPYRHGLTVIYEKSVPNEPPSEETPEILHLDSEILVADKPHGIPVTPSGRFVERSLLVQMRRATGNPALTPIHRLDRDTAGIVLFSNNPETRAAYHRLFQEGNVRREYLAVARLTGPSPEQTVWHIENRTGGAESVHRQAILHGSPNARTRIELVRMHEGFALFRLQPQTGRKHQLRLHMSHIGFPIFGDVLYGNAGEAPLQLLATHLVFIDPVSGCERQLQTRRKLESVMRRFPFSERSTSGKASGE